MYAIYARQSIEKTDSISIDTQVNQCLAFVKGDYQVYKDAGYSGSSTDRPDFQRMLSDIKGGKIRTVVSYRLDRISRSLTDFAKLVEFFQENNVQYISTTEQFDTSSPIGRAMVYIIMVFAQLERETIAGRIKDNYFARAKKGMFLGGKCPFGYKSIRTKIDGKECSALDIEPDQAVLVKDIFKRYTETSEALYAIAMSLPGPWTSNKVGRILKNPAYAKNSIDLYEYFKGNGYQVINDIDDFNGQNGCLLVGKERGRKNRVYTTKEEQSLIIGLHQPLIEASTYIKAQHKLSKNLASKRNGTGNISWLTGLLKCAECGHAITIKVSRKYVHFTCRGRTNYGVDTCNMSKFYRQKELEDSVQDELIMRCQNIDPIDTPTKTDPQELAAKAQILKIDEKIDNLLAQMSEGVVGAYITRKIEELDSKKREFQSKLKTMPPQIDILHVKKMRDMVLNEWPDLDVKLKHSVAEFFIKKIYLNNDEMKIEWAI